MERIKKFTALFLCFIIIFSLSACDTIITDSREVIGSHDEITASVQRRNISNSRENESREEPPDYSEPQVIPEPQIPLVLFDKSSPEAFIESIWNNFGIVLQDGEDFFSSDEGIGYMEEIEHVLFLFSPEFMEKMTDYFRSEHRAKYFLRLGGQNDDQYGLAEWRKNIIVSVFYDKNPEFCGITAPVLAHEIGHTIHYLVEEYIGEKKSEADMRAFNGDFDYVEDRYDRVWREKIHGTTFAYDYGMHCYYEDIATIFELLVEDPAEMTARLSDPLNEPLFLKTQYIREITYEYISDECYLIFMPLYEAEEILGLNQLAA